MKRNIAAIAALLVVTSLSQAALFALPSYMTRILNPVASMLGQRDASNLLNTLKLSPSIVSVQQATPNTVPLRAPEQVVSPIPAKPAEPRYVAPVVPDTRPRDGSDRQLMGKTRALDGRHDNGLHRGWFIGKHKGWDKNRNEQPRVIDRTDAAPSRVRTPGLETPSTGLPQALTK